MGREDWLNCAGGKHSWVARWIGHWMNKWRDRWVDGWIENQAGGFLLFWLINQYGLKLDQLLGWPCHMLASIDLATEDVLRFTPTFPFFLSPKLQEVWRVYNSEIENRLIKFRRDFLSPRTGVVNLGCTWKSPGHPTNHWGLGPTSRDSDLIIQGSLGCQMLPHDSHIQPGWRTTALVKLPLSVEIPSRDALDTQPPSLCLNSFNHSLLQASQGIHFIWITLLKLLLMLLLNLPLGNSCWFWGTTGNQNMILILTHTPPSCLLSSPKCPFFRLNNSGSSTQLYWVEFPFNCISVG